MQSPAESTVSLDDNIPTPTPPSPVSSIGDVRPNTDSMISVPLTDEDRNSTDMATTAATIVKKENEHNIQAQQEPVPTSPLLEELALVDSPEPTFNANRASLQEPDMAALLARLEMENNAIAKDPKAGIAAVGGHTGPLSQFEYRVRDTVCSSISTIHIPEEALGMSLGDFWTLVTKDYSEALDCLPTMTPLMIHKGVPPFLRSVVWVGMAGARDPALQAEYDSLVQRLVHERPQNESIINKDIARCFPNHVMFKDSEGEGQKMLGTILKCYSLYDNEIGYCQGMGFIVGILLMNMTPKDAFCVFVKMMEGHGLRTSFSPSLSGLHSRTYQLRKLLAQISPDLLDHLKSLGVELAYISQWFMTIFATTCPLDTLFRIYDVLFAEGADETIMRVALALIVSNEQKLMAMTEIEDVLHLLLGRTLWTPYSTEPDLLIDEITRLCHVVTKEALEKLHEQFVAQSEHESEEKTARALGFSSGFSGFKFLGWSGSPSNTKSTALSPGPSASLDTSQDTPRRTASKRSITTINSVSGDSGADSLMSNESNASTAPTEYEAPAERDSTTTFKSQRNARTEDRSLHEQVEGLLLALSEVQREAAQTAATLQEERARKNSMADIVFRLRDLVTQKEVAKEVADAAVKRDRRRTMPSKFAFENAQQVLKDLNRKSALINNAARSVSVGNPTRLGEGEELQDSLSRLCALLENDSTLPVVATPSSEQGPFFDGSQSTSKEPSSLVRPKRYDSGRTGSPKPRPAGGMSRQASYLSTQQDLISAPLFDHYHGTPSLSNLGFPSPMELESPDYWPEAAMFDGMPETSETLTAQNFGKRTSSLAVREMLVTGAEAAGPDEALLMELVNAKTREATANQERDEMKVALDRLRKHQEARDAREAEFSAKLHEMERLMLAQQEAHKAELEKLKLAKLPKKSPPSNIQIMVPVEKDRSNSLWPTPNESPEPLTPSKTPTGGSSGGGWGWFSKGRSVSTGNAGLSNS